MIYHNIFKYYRTFIGDKDRPHWLKYIDTLLSCGRQYYLIKPKNEPDFTLINDKEYQKLVGLMLKELNTIDIIDYLFDQDNESMFKELFIDLILNRTIIETYKIAEFMVESMKKSLSFHVETIFEDIKFHLENDMEGKENDY